MYENVLFDARDKRKMSRLVRADRQVTRSNSNNHVLQPKYVESLSIQNIEP